MFFTICITIIVILFIGIVLSMIHLEIKNKKADKMTISKKPFVIEIPSTTRRIYYVCEFIGKDGQWYTQETTLYSDQIKEFFNKQELQEDDLK